MENVEFSAIEKEMASFNFEELLNSTANAKKSFADASKAEDVLSEICRVWKSIRRFVVLAENIPFVGKFIKILATLLDSLCGAG